MFPFLLLAFLVSGIAYVATRDDDDDDRDPTAKLPKKADWVDDDVIDEPIGPPDEPVIEEPGEPEIPYGPRLLFEIWVDTDGQLLYSLTTGDQYDNPLEVEVCPGDTIVIHTPPQYVDDDAVGYVQPQDAGGADWLEPVVQSWEYGLFVWHVTDVPGGRRALVGVEIFDYDAQQPVPFGFDAVLLDVCEAVA